MRREQGRPEDAADPNAKPSNNVSAGRRRRPSEKPLPQNDPEPNEVKEIIKEETDVDAAEGSRITLPKPEITPPTPTPPKPEEKPPEEQRRAEEPPKPDAEALPDKRADARRQAAGKAAGAEAGRKAA